MFKKLGKNLRGRIDPKNIVMIVIAFFVFAVTFQIAMTAIDASTHTKWNPAVWTMYDTVMPILGVVGAIVGFLAYIRSGKGSAHTPLLILAKWYEKLKNNHKAGISVTDVVYLSMGLLISAYIFPTSMNSGVFGNTAVLTWATSPVYTLFTLVVPIIVIISLAMMYISGVGGKKK